MSTKKRENNYKSVRSNYFTFIKSHNFRYMHGNLSTKPIGKKKHMHGKNSLSTIPQANIKAYL